ncbi:DUF6249 domain-containing protein [Luteibacter aegosomatissinici]|uniref:DUF6249 domain-containing protein n=1 Tax=Luteibacter aegosomatissinici TaxID=2911539 RepID=UPI001FF9FCD9|nr:DUF6249 domain-containing protein [Luteibacter aegosomatissinici]UPG94915.1 hypothetical protein L2Y97_02060 [Luteibacter aegosomatissinici]
MNAVEALIPISLFFAIALVIKWIIDARFRHKMIQAGVTGELQKQWFEEELNQRRQSALRWGTVLTLLAVGFAFIQAKGWDELNPGVVAVLVACTGVGNLVYYAVSRRQVLPGA